MDSTAKPLKGLSTGNGPFESRASGQSLDESQTGVCVEALSDGRGILQPILGCQGREQPFKESVDHKGWAGRDHR